MPFDAFMNSNFSRSINGGGELRATCPPRLNNSFMSNGEITPVPNNLYPSLQQPQNQMCGLLTPKPPTTGLGQNDALMGHHH